MGPMHTLMPTQSLQPSQHLEYKVKTEKEITRFSPLLAGTPFCGLSRGSQAPPKLISR